MNLNEVRIFWQSTSNASKKCRKVGLDPSPILVLVVRLKIKHDKDVFFSHLCWVKKAVPHSEFGDLYQLRWRVEEDNKVFKERMGLINTTGRTLISVQQNFHAKVFTKNLTSILVAKPREGNHRQPL